MLLGRKNIWVQWVMSVFLVKLGGARASLQTFIHVEGQNTCPSLTLILLLIVVRMIVLCWDKCVRGSFGSPCGKLYGFVEELNGCASEPMGGCKYAIALSVL